MILKGVKKMNYALVNSPFGQLEAVYDMTALYFLGFKGNKSLLNRLSLSQQKSLINKPISWDELKGLPIKFLIGTHFQQQVWQALLEIPLGETRSYGDIAQRIGKPKALRAVGTAIGQNPISILVPCHRVIRSDKTLGGYYWGLECKRKLLKSEGVSLFDL